MVFGATALTALPITAPEIGSLWPVFAVYTLIAGLLLLLIYKGVGGRARMLVGGLIDIAALTYFVHAMGSATTMLVSVYVVLCVLYAVVSPPRMAMALSGLSISAYVIVMGLEYAELIPYAPYAPAWASHQSPSLGGLLFSLAVVGVLVPFSTVVVSRLSQQALLRERDLVVANQQLLELSQSDPLTGLHNRRHLFERLESELARVGRGHELTVLMIDLDNFKPVNDQLGHAAGDQLLCRVAQALRRETRAGDVVGRYGGDEFMVVLPDTGVQHAIQVADRLVAAVRELGSAAGLDVPMTASIGITAAEQGDDAAAVLERADENAYRAKESGGNAAAA